MNTRSQGLHHITAIAGDPQRNLAFYAGTLGLRFVKRTVNFDDPGTYHFYFGDRIGHPGTLLTFFPWADARPGRPGAGQETLTSYAIPAGSAGYWENRLGRLGVSGVVRRERFGETTLRLSDPDGLGLELVERTAPRGEAWPGSAVPVAQQITGLAGTTLTLRGTEATADLLVEALGFAEGGSDGGVRRMLSPDGSAVDLLRDPAGPSGTMGAGTVHHVAWRAADGADQLRLRGELLGRALGVTPVVDRQYFQSIYFREPGGSLFEIATDGPGFLTDELEAGLGAELRLPPQYEGNRAAIEAILPPLEVPAA